MLVDVGDGIQRRVEHRSHDVARSSYHISRQLSYILHPLQRKRNDIHFPESNLSFHGILQDDTKMFEKVSKIVEWLEMPFERRPRLITGICQFGAIFLILTCIDSVRTFIG